LAQLLDFGFFLLSGRCGLFHSFILPAFATEVFFDLNPYLPAESCGDFSLTWVTHLLAYDRFVLGMTIVNIVNLTA
jgi:hypothetical protein